MSKENEYQYLNSQKFTFDGEWKYGNKTYSDIRSRVLELLASFNAGDELLYDVINPYGSIDKSRFDGRDYVQKIFHSHMNLFLHYSLSQVALAVEKFLAIPESELVGLSSKERSKKFRENERLIIETYAKSVKEFN